jgi:hypothetical protein
LRSRGVSSGISPKSPLTFTDELRLELTGTVARHVNLDLTALTFDSFLGLAVSGVGGLLPGSIVLLVAEVVGHLALQGTLNHCFGELLQETIVAEHVFG